MDSTYTAPPAFAICVCCVAWSFYVISTSSSIQHRFTATALLLFAAFGALITFASTFITGDRNGLD